MPYPDDLGLCPDLHPTIQDLHREMVWALAARHGKAMGQIDGRIDFLTSRLERLGDDDLHDVELAERVAKALDALCEAFFPGARS